MMMGTSERMPGGDLVELAEVQLVARGQVVWVAEAMAQCRPGGGWHPHFTWQTK